MKYIGLANIIFFVLGIFYLIKQSKNINLNKDTLSTLGNDKKVGLFFNLLIIIFALVQVLFAKEVCEVVLKNPNSIALPFFYISGLALFTAGVFTTKRHPNIHKIMAGLSASLAGIGVLIISISLIGQNTLLAFVTLLATLSIPIGFSLRKQLPGSRWELIILGGIIVLNIALSYPLIFK